MDTPSKTRSIQLNGHTFNVTQLPAMRALKLFQRLGKTAGPALAHGLASAATMVNDEEPDLSGLAVAVGMLFDRLSESEVEGLTRELLASATYDGSSMVMSNFDALFQGELPSLFKLLAFALEVNFGNFKDVLTGLVRMGQAQVFSLNASARTSKRAGPLGASGT
jgi:hypothetical protein